MRHWHYIESYEPCSIDWARDGYRRRVYFMRDEHWIATVGISALLNDSETEILTATAIKAFDGRQIR